ncbi:MAG: multiple sugar transport system ATP-binding protein [Thermomicrobiales bacterium]|jgi:multiple sugar transport system ATP-binding protein|nr:multiple sugar transport system ATP-binding protein [Thermomicrobiales bacterium]MEA2597641.1 multiple sugar transport system ATP-binding protein [Thermomicrobiales bacterium]
MANVSVRHVEKVFGTVRAVNDVSLEIRDREFLVLLGPSGCGKTTLLRMVAGLERPTGGEIYIGDRLVNFTPPKDRDVAMVFQNYALYPHMDVTDNITLGLRLHHTPKGVIGQRLEAAASWLQLSGLLKRMPRQLSGGQQQRVALGRSVVREPKVFLMDEPLSNLDARLRVQMRTELIKLHRRLGATIVYVTHDQSEAMTMATRVAIMRDGVLQQCDAPLTVYRHPANKYVAAFMGNPEMNFLRATVAREEGEWLLTGPTFRVPVPPERGAALARYQGQSVWLGVRPEAISVRPQNGAAGGVPAVVDVVSPMGGNTLVYALAEGETIVADVPSDIEPAVGERITLVLDPAKLHAFDVETEQALW